MSTSVPILLALIWDVKTLSLAKIHPEAISKNGIHQTLWRIHNSIFCFYSCRCMNGWYGIHCTQRTVDCLASSSYNLCDHGVCVHTNDANGYRCICDQGWISNGTTPACSTDVDECNSPTPHCSVDPEVPCINLPGTYACGQCPHGM